METLYLVLLIIFIVVAIGAGLVLIYLKNDESKLKEVTTSWLHKMGKDYSKEEFENTMFNQYMNIEYAKVNDDYNELKDIVSDEEYNNILLEVKKERETNTKRIVKDIKKGLVKLISFKLVNNQEVAKIWIQYSDIEYITGYREDLNQEDTIELKNVIISGSDNKPVFHEYVLTFVKDRSTTEKITCPNCGHEIKTLLRSKCPMCENIIVPKTGHWVYVSKDLTQINKK